jgi:hypothetical protein
LPPTPSPVLSRLPVSWQANDRHFSGSHSMAKRFINVQM